MTIISEARVSGEVYLSSSFLRNTFCLNLYKPFSLSTIVEATGEDESLINQFSRWVQHLMKVINLKITR